MKVMFESFKIIIIFILIINIINCSKCSVKTQKSNYLGQSNYPEVIELDPPNDATNVNPNKKYIIVKFNQPMMVAYSWVDKGMRPKINKIDWIDEYQCRAQVELEPNKEYGLWLNFGKRTSKFRNKTGVSAQKFYWKFQTGSIK